MSDAQRMALEDTCHAIIDGVDNSYGYRPSVAAGVVFCILFGLSMVVHTVQFIWKRTWWCSVFAIGCLSELIGWAGRLWSAECPYNGNAFLMQITTLIIAPVFFTAGIYVLLGRFIYVMGRHSSFLTPKMHLWIFCTCDVISLVIQAIGGGVASSASDDDKAQMDTGTHIMVGGIVFQLASITLFVVCAVDFLWRVLRRGSGVLRDFVPLIGAMVFSMVCIYIRSIYRTVELLQGWTGYLITHEVYFVVLDGVMMVLAVVVFNVFHPGWLLPEKEDSKLEEKGSTSRFAMEMS